MINRAIKILSLCLAFCLAWNCSSLVVANAKGLGQRRAELQKSLDSIDNELKRLGQQSKDTREYINTLDKRLSILRKQYAIAEQEIASDNNRIINIEHNIEENAQQLFDMEQDIPNLIAERQAIETEFDTAFDDCCKRQRAIYISGGKMNNAFSILLSCNGISMMLNRLQMVSSIAKQDSQMLQYMQNRAKRLDSSSKALKQKQNDVKNAQIRLTNDKAELKRERASLFEKEEDLAKQKSVIEKEQSEANRLLKQLDDRTKEYGEYRDITSDELAEIDRAIAYADRMYQQSIQPTSSDNTDTSTTKKSDKYIHLTYPCPAYTRINCGFGEYEGHSGCDFSTEGNENQKIVASEDGTVILVRLLDYSYGHYLVIRHTRLTRKGERVYTLYAHNNDILVSEGQNVKKGQQIAYSGTTGNSTGPHCHFEVRVGGSNQSDARDPVRYLS